MANTDLIIPIVVALVGLLGSLVGLFMSWRSQKLAHGLSIDLEAAKEKINKDLETHKGEVTKDLDENKLHVEHKQTVSDLTEKYSQPLLVAAYDLQQRLYDLAEFPISRQHLTKPEGLQDLKMFTCYLLAQYLAYTYILRTKLGYLSFSKDNRLKKLRKLMYIIDEELDRRRDDDGQNIGVWPAARILVCERILCKTDDSHAALDGGFGVEVKGFDQFRGEWQKGKWHDGFEEPMGYFCQWIDWMLEGRLRRDPGYEGAVRCLQHLLVDLVRELDRYGAYIPEHKDSGNLKCNPSTVGCDCDSEICQVRRKEYNLDEVLRERQSSRLSDPGIWAYHGHHKDGRRESHRTPNSEINLSMVKEITCLVDLI